MVKRTAQHLRDHLLVFEPDFPVQKGFVARLLKNDGLSTSDVVAALKGIVHTALPDKQVNEVTLRRKVDAYKQFINKKHNLSREWPKLIELFLQPFPITFVHLVATSSQPGHTPPSQHPEPTFDVLPSEKPIEPDTSQTSTLAPVNLPSVSGSYESLSPKILKKDCRKCATLRRTVLNVTLKNRHLLNDIKQLKKQLKQKDKPKQTDQKQSKIPRKRLTEMIKRKTQLADKRKAKLADLKEKYEDAEIKLKSLDLWKQSTNAFQAALTYSREEVKTLTKSNHQLKSMLQKQNMKIQSMREKHIAFQKTANSDAHEMQKLHNQLVHKLEQKVKTLERAIVSFQEKNSNMTSVKVRFKSIIANTDKLNATLKQKNEQLKTMLDNTETANAHFKQHGHLRNIPDETENDDAHLKSNILLRIPGYRQGSHSPEMEIEEELLFDTTQNTDMDLSVLAEIIGLDHDYGQSEVKQKATYDEDVGIMSTESMDGDMCSTQDVRSGGDRNKQTQLQSDQPPVLHSDQSPVLPSDQPLVFQFHQPPVFQSEQPPVLQSDQPSVLQLYRCDFCNHGFRQLSSLQTHRLVHTGERTFKCSFCGYGCRLYKSLKRHTLLKHPEKYVYKNTQCDLCGSAFYNSQCFHHHMLKHTDKRCYKCDVCGREFTNKCVLQCHMRIHTLEKPYRCQVCGFECTFKSTLDLHKLTHAGEGPFQCGCGLVFLHNADIKKHKKLHSEQKNYVCVVCGYRNRKMSSLKLHMTNHTGEKPYQCGVCHKTFTQKGNLNSHIRTHTEEKPYQCDVCDKRFSQNSGLKTHKRVHTGERPYKCDVYGFTFKFSSGLIRHKMIHTGDKRYMCDICGFQVNRKSNLKLHKKIH
ncbi:hypothetical protein BsWGS_13655 [Bradybaena similaris]